MVLDIDEVRTEALGCTRCRLSEGRTNVVWAAGNLDSELLFIGEAPGFHEDQQGIPFVGAAGKLLDTLLAEIGLDRGKAAIVNVLKCRPPNNRDPQPDEIESCRPYLEAQLAHMRPKVIVTLGNFATRFILEQQVGITKVRGQMFDRRNAVVIPTFHPAAALRGGRFGGMSPTDAMRQDLQLVKAVLDGSIELTRVSDPPVEPSSTPTPSQEERSVSVGAPARTEADSEQLGLF